MEVGAYVREAFRSQIEIEFITEQRTEFGSEVRVVGSSSELGSWSPGQGISLTTATESYPYWRVTMWVPVSPAGWEYKFVVVKCDNSVEWEHCANRILAAPTPTSLGAPLQSLNSTCTLEPVRILAAPTSLGAPLQSLNSACTLEPVRASSDCWHPLVGDDLDEQMMIVFEVIHTGTCPGDELIVTGDAHSLGSWNPSKGLRLTTCKASFPVWRGGSRLNPSDLNSAWKIVCHRADGQYEWEQREDRRVCQQHMRDLSVEAWLISVRFSGEHDDPVPYEKSDFSLLLGSLPQRENIAYGCRVDSSASTCLPDDECSESNLEDLEPLEVSKVSPASIACHSFQLWSGAHQIEKARGCCEDAYFQGDYSLGVADGVGSMIQFAKYGADSAAYAADLMQRASAWTLALAHVDEPEGSAQDSAVAALSHAEQEAKAYGASTALVLALKGNSVGVANLGDSGFFLLRRTSTGLTIIERSMGQQHSWNCPYQLLRLPPAVAVRVPKSFKPDLASDCERMEVRVIAGDLLILFTDGMVDNLHEHEMLNIINRLAGTVLEPGCPQLLARELVTAAHARSLDPQAEVPFTLASRLHGQQILGGKPDDITVVAAWVMQHKVV